MQERLAAARLDAPVRAQRAQHRLEHALGGEQVGARRVGVAPARRPVVAADQRGDPRALDRQVRVVRRVPGVAGRGRRQLAGRRARQVDGAGLEQPHVLEAARAVAAQRVEQRAEQRRAHHRLVLGHRVLERDDVVLQAEPGEHRGAGEAPADRLGEARADQRVLRPAADPLLGLEPADRAAARGQRRREPVQPPDPRDLLDQVRLAGHVVAAPGRHGHVEPVGSRLPRRTRARSGSRPRRRAGPPRRAAARCAHRAAAASPAPAPGRRRRSSRPRAARRTARASARSRPPGPRAPARAGAASRCGPTPPCAAPGGSRCAGCSARSRSPPPSARGSSRRGPRSARRPSRRRSRSGRRRRRSRPSRRRACAPRRRASSSSRRRARAGRPASRPRRGRRRTRAAAGPSAASRSS